MTMSFIWAKIVYDFSNAIFSKRDHREAVVCFFKMISRKFGSVVDYSAQFRKEIVKYLSFPLEICNMIFKFSL